MPAPTSYPPFQRDYPSEDPRPSPYASSRPRTEPERVALPSIRQAFPDLLPIRPNPRDGTASNASPTAGLPGPTTPPEYVHSPNSGKRRRLSFEEERTSQVPRLYASSSGSMPRQSRGTSPGLLPRSATENWGSSSRTSPYPPSLGGPSSIHSPAILEPPETVEHRPALPSLPPLAFEREAPPPAAPARRYSREEYPSRSGMMHPSQPGMESAYRPAAYGGPGYHHSSRGQQTVPMGALHPYERAAMGGHGYGQYPDYMRMGDYGGMNGDMIKQRKRRGNLPKETTDKLRAWFVAHLHHPYPTEDEKQDLMRRTGLQMNQISNWFINARRRQLPTMISNAKVETDAMSSGRNSDDRLMRSTEKSEYDSRKSRSPLSEGGSSHYEDEMDDMRRRSPGGRGMKRGSV
ncbi:uncharacterized protein E0L32_007199 [Thyridium curvatum]|uniref:Homeobox domain-containing protein n=1 Tax=Thyridium curvatum TaxID=1093900 RepID=A0A507B047_9PEZI|nr:uncharacterized protein E0L32_007199 [Thyridium curvatum]TPX12084.1 hypothetical protein E0L32_007199 [Thyridium curvatum]